MPQLEYDGLLVGKRIQIVTRTGDWQDHGAGASAGHVAPASSRRRLNAAHDCIVSVGHLCESGWQARETEALD